MPIVVISGASGLLGRSVLSTMKSSLDEHTVVGLGFSRCTNDIRQLDLTDPNAVEKLFVELHPVLFVHCAAERRPDIVESGNPSAKAVNITATELLAQKCAAFGCKLFFISTDYVFDGSKPPYDESSIPNPLNTYGQQKLDGEKVVLKASSNNVVIRVPVLYGPLDTKFGLDESAVTVLFKAVKNVRSSVKLDHVAIRYPTLTTDVADFIVKLAKASILGNSISGIIHFSGSEAYTKYEMAVRMAMLFGLPSAHLIADVESALKADTKRPINAQLSCKLLEELQLSVTFTKFDDGIKACLMNYV